MQILVLVSSADSEATLGKSKICKPCGQRFARAYGLLKGKTTLRIQDKKQFFLDGNKSLKFYFFFNVCGIFF